MALKKPTTVYGGPYSQESDAITLESSKKKPNYDQLISGWKTVSQGALDYIASLESPVEREEGPFVDNVKIDYDKVDNTIPATADFDRDREKLGEGDLVEDSDKTNTNGAGEVPTPKDVAEGQLEVDLDKL